MDWSVLSPVDYGFENKLVVLSFWGAS